MPGQNVTVSNNREYTFPLTFEMANATYSQEIYGCPTCYKDVVTATPTWTIDDSSLTDSVQTLNYDALTTMFKLESPPKYSRAWQAAAMAIDKMNMQSFQLFLYSPYLYANYFNENMSSSIRSDVIGTNGGAGLDSTCQFSISLDPQFGMVTPKALTYWVNATIEYNVLGVEGGYAWTVIQNHFKYKASQSCEIDNTAMKSMVGG